MVTDPVKILRFDDAPPRRRPTHAVVAPRLPDLWFQLGSRQERSLGWDTMDAPGKGRGGWARSVYGALRHRRQPERSRHRISTAAAVRSQKAPSAARAPSQRPGSTPEAMRPRPPSARHRGAAPLPEALPPSRAVQMGGPTNCGSFTASPVVTSCSSPSMSRPDRPIYYTGEVPRTARLATGTTVLFGVNTARVWNLWDMRKKPEGAPGGSSTPPDAGRRCRPWLA
jgi:hypothetical protein